MAPSAKKTYSFGHFELVLPDRVLLQDGDPVALKPRAIEVLAALITHANEVITKEDLMREVWPDAFVEEGNLAVHISALRKLFSGSGGEVEIETIPRCGYRLVGEVRDLTADSAAKSPSAQISSDPIETCAAHAQLVKASVAHRDRWRLYGALAVVVCLLILAGEVLERWASRAPAGVEAGGARIHSLAVLPLQNLSGDPAQDYFAAGITDELTTEIAHIHGLSVVSRTSASRFKDSSRSLPEIAGALSVDGVLEGSVVRSGGSVRITTQLIEAKEDRHVWAGTYEGSVDEIIALQDRVARDVAREVQAAVKPEAGLLPVNAQAAPASVNPQAYDDYLRGLYIWNRRDSHTFGKAIEYFSRATTEDPQFAPAFASLADVYILVALNGDNGGQYASRAREAALRAISLDGQSAEAHTALGAVSAAFDWDWANAGREFEQAVQLNPNYATGHQWYADFYLIPMLQLEDGQKELNAAVVIDPLSPIMLVDRGWVSYLRGDYSQAKQYFDKALAMDPNFEPAVYRMQNWYLVQGRDAEFAQQCELSLKLLGESEDYIHALEDAYAHGGVAGLSNAQIAETRRKKVLPSAWGAAIAIRFSLVGDTTNTCAALKNGIRMREPAMLYVNVYPVYAKARRYPCYADIARDMGLPQLPDSAQPKTPAN